MRAHFVAKNLSSTMLYSGMRIKIMLSSDKEIFFPIAYNHILQGFIYNALSHELADFLHDRGYVINNRRFKLFTFSRLFGNYRIYKKTINFISPIYFYLSSPFTDILEEMVNRIFSVDKPLILGKNLLQCTEVSVLKMPSFDDGEYKIKMLSPVTVYSTINLGGKDRTHYYNPQDVEFNSQIIENLKKKYRLIEKKDSLENHLLFSITPLKVDLKRDFILTQFKDTIIKGWMGKYKIRGDKELIRVAYDAGLGSKNSAGFGMWELIR